MLSSTNPTKPCATKAKPNIVCAATEKSARRQIYTLNYLLMIMNQKAETTDH